MAGLHVYFGSAFLLRALVVSVAVLGSAARLWAQGEGVIMNPAPVNRLPATGPAMGTVPRNSDPGVRGSGPSYAPPVASLSNPNRPVDTPIDSLVELKVVEIRVVGNRAISTAKVLHAIKTRVDRPFDQATLEKDVRLLYTKGWFLDARPIREQVPGGVRITFEVVERPMLEYVKYLGNHKYKDSRLAKKTELKKGLALDPYAVEEGRRKIEEYYREKGYNDVQVTIMEGTKPSDRGAIFLIDEGTTQKVKGLKFEGNTIASDGRLKTQVQSKPPILWIFKGQVDQKKIQEDVDKLTAYYRSLGFFRARVGREIEYDKNHKWATINFVISEGPRYKVRNVSFVGTRKFDGDELAKNTQLKGGEFFDQGKLSTDRTNLQDAYGSQGYVFANVKEDLRFLEEPGQLDVVFSVEEGSRYSVGRINIHIDGDNPHTRYNTIYNRLGFRPGDIVDTQKIRNAERRLKASSLFVNDPAKGQVPKITFSPPENDGERGIAKRNPDSFRGQSPDNGPDERPLELNVFVKLTPEVPPAEVPATTAPQLPNPGSPPHPGRDPPAQSAPASQPPAEPQGSATEFIVRGQGPAEMDDAAYAAGPPEDARLRWSRPQAAPRSQQPARYQAPPTYPAVPQAYQPTAQPTAARPDPAKAASAAPVRPIGEGWGYDQQRGFVAVNKPINEAPNPYKNLSLPGKPQQQPRAADNSRAADDDFSITDQMVVRGQSGGGYGGRLLQPMSPAPQSNSAYSGAVNQPGYSAPPTGYASPPPGYASPPAGYANPPAAYGAGAPPLNEEVAAEGQPAANPFGPQGEVLPPPGGFNMGPPVEPPPTPLLMDIGAQESQTGQLMFGLGVNSNAGVVGSVVINENNFDWRRVPTSLADIRNGTAFRGAGQHFRIEAAPGTQVSRYLFSFQEPYLWDTMVSFGLSGFYYQRFFNDWFEQRTGGRVSLGYQFRPDLTGSVAFRAENVHISNPRILVPDLQAVLGSSALFGGSFTLANDTRDNTFFPTEGRYIAVMFEQCFGTFTFPRATVDMRKYIPLFQRADGSGRHVLSLYGYLGASGKNTPIYERFFLGGIGTLRGFYFRGASPTFDTVQVGGDFTTYGTVEYTMPVTADDMFRIAAFCDVGVDSPTARVRSTDLRVAPGLGIRVAVPAMGPAPIAIDFAVPVVLNSNDQKQLVNFSMGVAR